MALINRVVDILEAILPEELIEGVPQGFAKTGHVGELTPFLDQYDRDS